MSSSLFDKVLLHFSVDLQDDSDHFPYQCSLVSLGQAPVQEAGHAVSRQLTSSFLVESIDA